MERQITEAVERARVLGEERDQLDLDMQENQSEKNQVEHFTRKLLILERPLIRWFYLIKESARKQEISSLTVRRLRFFESINVLAHRNIKKKLIYWKKERFDIGG